MHKLVQRGQDDGAWSCPEGMPPLIYRLLSQRGVSSTEQAQAFLHPSADHLHDPLLLSDMEKVIARLCKAREANETVCVYGDYDVDGVCATAMLTLYFSSIGMKIINYIPDRHSEGYGLNDDAIRMIAKDAALIVTVDCGISSIHEVETAKSLGMDIIITDHHRPGDRLPDCLIVNPLLNNYPFPHLCGTGVAFKLVSALEGKPALDYIDLAALATVADLVSLTDENRIIVSLGLKQINSNPRIGLEVLISRARLVDKTITAGHIGFQIAPRINAGGRLGSARRGLMLLTAQTDTEAIPYADELEAENTLRRREEQKIITECASMMVSYDLLAHRIIVLRGEGWDAGVIGLAASRLVTEYHYPVILLSDNDGKCVGSCRSIPAVDIFAALSSCADLMTRFGGHRQAAGLAMPRANVPELITRLDEFLRSNTVPDDYIPEVEYDLPLPLGQIDEKAVLLMERLQPCGYGNPSPVFITKAHIDSARSVGKEGAHLQVRISQNSADLPGICFGQGKKAQDLAGTEREVLFAPQLNEWHGKISVQCEIKEFLTEPCEEVFNRFDASYPRYLRTYLTKMLYNVKPYPHHNIGLISGNQLRRWLQNSPQGTVIAAVTQAGAQSLWEYLKAYELTDRVDAVIGQWDAGQTAMNTVCLCPTGATTCAYEHVVLWDAPPEAFEEIPKGTLLLHGSRIPNSWMALMPDVDALRTWVIALRKWNDRTPLQTMEDIERSIARCAGRESDIELTASLAILNSLKLIEVDWHEGQIRLLPSKKCSPEEDVLYRRLRILYDYAMEKRE